jgi:hypothetical protein
MTPTEAFESKLASQSADSTVLRGVWMSFFTVSSTPSGLTNISPASFGVRAAAMGTLFSRFRVKYLRIKFISTSNPAISSVLGILDDSSVAEGDAPTTSGGVLELRCSGSSLSNATVPTQLLWRPTDPKKWYYCYSGQSGSDPRLFNCGVLYGATPSTGSSAVILEIDFCLVFKGAVDVGSS